MRDESRFKAIIDTAVDGVILIDAEGTVRVFNPACERLFGYTAAEIVGQNVKMLMPAPYRGEHDGYLRNYRDTGQAKIIGIGREVEGQRKDGSTFPMHLSVGESVEGGRPNFVGIVHDLTALKESERALRESAARLNSVVETAVDGVILIDARGAILMFNPACERLFGYVAGEVIGQNVKLLMPPPYRDEHDGYLRNYRDTREAKIIGIGREVVGLRKDGSTFPMDLSVGEAVQEGEAVYVGMIRDLTDRKRTEEQLVQAQKMEAVGQLSGGVAHDFNNLLTVIIGNAETLSDRLRARPDLKAMIDLVHLAGRRGAELTSRLLAFSRKQILKPVELDCNALIDGMQRLLRRTLREDIEIELALADGLPRAIADAGQLEAALLNLALNAQDAMPDGGRLVFASQAVDLDGGYRELHPEVLHGRYVALTVTDDGAGMPAEVLNRAFEPFFTTKDVGKGTGLGLSMVYGFAKQSNGHVSLYSEPGLGTSVRLYLPVAGDAAPRSGPAASETPAQRRTGSETIMVVEDDPFVRNYTVTNLQNLGYRVDVAANGREALQRLQAGERPDLVFSDVVMPGGVSGWDLAAAIRDLVPGMRILLTSGYPWETRAGAAGAPADVPILSKPYGLVELAARIRAALDENK